MVVISKPVAVVEDESNVDRWRHRLLRWAPWLLGFSLAVRLIGSVPIINALFIDLHVYVLGGTAVEAPGTLYSLVYTDSHGEQLPFVYPPFAAMLFYPLHLVPFPVVAWVWQAAMVVGLYCLVRISQRMVGGGSRRGAMLWTAVGIWLEPMRNTLDLSQVGVFLTLAVLYAAYTSRSWLAGLLIGLAAGVKVTPAISVFYLMGMRRWTAVAVTVAAFLGTVGLSALVLPGDTKLFFTELLDSTERFGSAGYVFNQSWQGTLARISGHDVGRAPLLIGAIAVTAVVAAIAWRALGTNSHGRDVLGSLLVVQLFGLMASPISWAHHWVWVVPLLIWLFDGPWKDNRGAATLRWVWVALLLVGVPTLLSLAPHEPEVLSRPWYLAWGGAVYVPMTLATFAWIILAGRASRRLRSGRTEPDRRPGATRAATGSRA
jgi:hypothetical protein